MKVSFRVEGDRVLAEKFIALSGIAKPEVLWRAATSGMLIIVNDAKRRAQYLTGTLRRSIHVGGAGDLTPDFAPGEAYHDLGRGQQTSASVEVYGGTNVIYAKQREFGGTIRPKAKKLLSWMDRTTGKRIFAKSVTQKAHPFMRPAFDTKHQAAVQEVGAALTALIEAIAKR